MEIETLVQGARDAVLGLSVGEMFGFLGAALIISAYSMRTMWPLRLCAVASNLAMICYGVLDGLAPMIALHATLLPLNLTRIVALLRAPPAEVRPHPGRARS